MTALSEQLRRRIAALRPDWNVADVSGFIFMEGGYSNDNYRFEYGGERYVLRLPAQQRPFVDRHLEQRLYAEAAEVGMPRLAAFDVDSGDMITHWVAGPMLADRHPDAASVAAYLDRLHRGLPFLDRVYDPVAQARAHLHAAPEVPPWLDSLAARLTWQPGTLVSCHNDLNPWNVICAPDGWVTLDWEWAGRNDPLFDVVSLHQGAGLPDADLPALAARIPGAQSEPGRLERCLAAFWLRETSWALAEIAAGSARREVREQRELGLARLQALAAHG